MSGICERLSILHQRTFTSHSARVVIIMYHGDNNPDDYNLDDEDGKENQTER